MTLFIFLFSSNLTRRYLMSPTTYLLNFSHLCQTPRSRCGFHCEIFNVCHATYPWKAFFNVNTDYHHYFNFKPHCFISVAIIDITVCLSAISISCPIVYNVYICISIYWCPVSKRSEPLDYTQSFYSQFII